MEEKNVKTLNILSKILKLVLKIMYEIFVVFCFFLILVVIWQVVTDNNESIGGYRLFRIMSGSMVPEFDIDEVVVTKDTEPENVFVGDVIVYRGKAGDLANKLIMHEVIDIKKVEEKFVFHVKGIQNTTGDPDVLENQILGVVVHKSKLLTYLYNLATSTYSAFFIIVILVINVFISFLPSKEKVMTLEESKKMSDFTNNSDVEDKIEYENDEEEIEKEDINIENERLKIENKKLEEEIKILKEEINKKK